MNASDFREPSKMAAKKKTNDVPKKQNDDDVDKVPNDHSNAADSETVAPKQKLKCGIVMPMSDMVGYPTGHFDDVKKILVDAIKDADFDADLVSASNEVRIIHEEIVQGLYDVRRPNGRV